MYSRLFYILVSLALLGSALVLGQVSVPNSSETISLTPLVPLKTIEEANRIKDHYIIVLKEGSTERQTAQVISALAHEQQRGSNLKGIRERAAYHARLASLHGGRIQHVFQGLAARLSAAELALLRRHPDISYIEEDGIVNGTLTQSSPTWGIDRIDQSNLPLDSKYTYAYTGSGVNVYVIDSGIRISHSDFEGRASNAFSAIGQNDFTDCAGHGTHVAGTIGSKTYGVAKKARLYAVRVLDCSNSGSASGLISGIDWVRGNAQRPAVASMSIGGGVYTALDQAIANLVTSGVTAVVAGGNDNSNSCNFSPARSPSAITVGATTQNDQKASFSNWGTCLDIFAPGESITSLGIKSDTATDVMSGTSMATPHVSGVVAQYLEKNPRATPAEVTQYLISIAVANKIQSPGTGSPNKLLQTVPGSFSPTPTSSPAPTTTQSPQPTQAPVPPIPSPPAQPPSAPCSGCTKYSGQLKFPGDFSVQPSGTYFQTIVQGTHRAWLIEKTPSVDFKISLLQVVNNAWAVVASGTSNDNGGTLSYDGQPGVYYYRITSVSGAGDFDVYLDYN